MDLLPEAKASLRGFTHGVLQAGVVAAFVSAAALYVTPAYGRRRENPGVGAFGTHWGAPSRLISAKASKTAAKASAKSLVAAKSVLVSAKAMLVASKAWSEWAAAAK